ncbi:hypothetical protein H0H93_009931 [Arthromyces matolae]|nr:hypothetical protein H0H93_009931 [Arthromyces matolae]
MADESSRVSKAYKPDRPLFFWTSYSLNYKGLPFEIVWVELPEIEVISKKLGTKPTGFKFGGPFYTVPTIYDPNTDTAIAESALIAEYLDATYPTTPKLFPHGTCGLQHAFVDAFLSKVEPVFQFTMPRAWAIMNPPSQEHFRRRREAAFGKTLEQIVPTGDRAAQEWSKLRSGLDFVAEWMDKGDTDGPFFMGHEPVFADFVVGSFIRFIRAIFGVDSPQWKDISTWKEGKWIALIDRLQKFEASYTPKPEGI